MFYSNDQKGLKYCKSLWETLKNVDFLVQRKIIILIFSPITKNPMIGKKST